MADRGFFRGWRRRSCVALVGLFFAMPAMAWGPQGHALVADIAAAHLTPAAQAKVADLLARDGVDHLDKIASWPDAIRSKRPATGPWHYVDIPLGADHYQARRDCPRDNCVIARLAQYANVLGDASAAPDQRLEALKFVVHFVGDVHQPLHAENHDDKGGNAVHLRYFGHRTNLHAVWDSGIIEHALGLTVHRGFTIDYGPTRAAAEQLDARVTPHERKIWGRDIHADRLQQAAIRWADQSHRLARTVAYADLPPTPRDDWSEAYQRRAWPVVRRQIQRAGIRLAGVLNAVLGH